jgi:ketosteroid isomerase-like protein
MRRMADPEDEVVEANARFYRAFEALDVAAMDEAWAHDEHVKCVHPGWPLLTGWAAVRESWARIFENTEEMRFTISDVHVVVTGETGWVTCTENILSEVHGRLSVTKILATNLFERGLGGWRMIHHHGSHIMAPAG